jgi:hypothetical protein
MSNETNDQRILQLKEQIEKKKEQLGKSTRFTPLTNCSLELEGERYNINVLSKKQLVSLMIRLNMYKISASDLGIMMTDVEFSGYDVFDWIKDIKAKIEILSRKDEERNLKAMEDKLVKLLSDGKKVELELDEIASLLK